MAYISEPSLVDPQKVAYVDKLRRIHHLPDPVTHLHLFQMQKFPSISFLPLEALNESWVFFVLSDSYLSTMGGIILSEQKFTDRQVSMPYRRAQQNFSNFFAQAPVALHDLGSEGAFPRKSHLGELLIACFFLCILNASSGDRLVKLVIFREYPSLIFFVYP